MPGPDGVEASLGHVLAVAGSDPARYDRLVAHFWVFHPTLGEPALMLLFSGGPQPPLAVLIEAKLWAGTAPEPARTILADVALFLGRLGLEYFGGFRRVSGLLMLSDGDGVALRSGESGEFEPIATPSRSKPMST